MTAISDAIPAATLVVMRDLAGAAPELLMVERAAGLAFAGGALVYPGGRIDPGDDAMAATSADDQPDLAARIAAIRETIEETGIAVGLSGATPEAVRAARVALHAGMPFGEALGATGLSLDTAALVPFAQWCPRLPQSRTFDTLFFLACAPADTPEPEPDAGESVRAFWTTAQAVLDASARGDARIIFPTRRNLERLALFESFADAVADARVHPIKTITPWIEERDGIEHLCIPEGLGYPVTAEPLAKAERY